MICGVLLLGIAFVTIIISLATTVDKISREEKNRKVLSNIEVKATKLNLVGQGNFVLNSPNYKDRVISDYKVKFMNIGDKVSYSLKVCNNNDENVIVNGISMGNVNCSDMFGNDRSCDNVRLDKYILDGSRILETDSTMKAKTCYTVVIDAEYIGNDLDEELFVEVKQFVLDVEVIEK